MILDKIAEATKIRVQAAKNNMSPALIKKMAVPSPHRFSFEKALTSDEIAFICEVKKGSPSKGVIAQDFPYVQIAVDYQQAGASAISVLTEPQFFLGKNDYLTKIKKAVSIPLLRKDFIIDEYQIFESAVFGSDAILLICALLSTEQI
ncbi:MAG: indole-3-glycerol phosphate synthase TrpC, partial [Eubacteriales bacterium]